jgi:hypothetical protein
VALTLEEVEQTLPNGLHDAEVQRINIDYQQRTLTLDMEVWTGDMDDPPDRREAYRGCQIKLTGLVFFIVEPPDARYPYRLSKKLRVDTTDARKSLDSELIDSLPEGTFLRSFWVAEWNNCMHFAATSAELTWNGNPTVYRNA